MQVYNQLPYYFCLCLLIYTSLKFLIDVPGNWIIFLLERALTFFLVVPLEKYANGHIFAATFDVTWAIYLYGYPYIYTLYQYTYMVICFTLEVCRLWKVLTGKGF